MIKAPLSPSCIPAYKRPATTLLRLGSEWVFCDASMNEAFNDDGEFDGDWEDEDD